MGVGEEQKGGQGMQKSYRMDANLTGEKRQSMAID
jgi:hypothetical protein